LSSRVLSNNDVSPADAIFPFVRGFRPLDLGKQAPELPASPELAGRRCDLAAGQGGEAMGNGTTVEPPLPPEERRRRMVVLCCNFMRNLALHRAGLRGAVRDNLLNPHHPQGEFWVQAHGNFLDACVMDWWKLFADYDGEHHWHRVVGDSDRACFGKDLHAVVGRAEFNKTKNKVDRYRNKFVAHLDNERMMKKLPELEVARKAVVFLHERLAQQIANRAELRGLPASPEELEMIFKRATEQAESVYADALLATAQR
jgi:hypothetical protein